MLLVRNIENNQNDAYSMSGQVENSLNSGSRNRKKLPPKLILNNPRSSINTESTPDPLFFGGGGDIANQSKI